MNNKKEELKTGDPTKSFSQNNQTYSMSKIPSYKSFIPYHKPQKNFNLFHQKHSSFQTLCCPGSPIFSGPTFSQFPKTTQGNPKINKTSLKTSNFNTVNNFTTRIHSRVQSSSVSRINNTNNANSSIFYFKTKLSNNPNNNQNLYKMRPLSSLSPIHKTKSKTTKIIKLLNQKKKNRRFADAPVWKKFLRAKLLKLVKKNIVLCEKKFNPTSFTESLTLKQVKEYKNKFRNLDGSHKVGIFTNKNPTILNQRNKFYTRYFDCFISPDELLSQNFTNEEIFQIRADPVYFNFGSNFDEVKFFQRKSLKETLNAEEKIGSPEKLIKIELEKSLKQTKKRIGKYLNYYTSIMSQQDLLK